MATSEQVYLCSSCVLVLDGGAWYVVGALVKRKASRR